MRRTRLDRLLDQAARAGCDVPLAKMVLGIQHSLAYQHTIKMYYRSWGTILMHELFVFGPTDLCRAKDADDSLPPINCVQLHYVKSKLMMNHLFQLYEMLRLSS